MDEQSLKFDENHKPDFKKKIQLFKLQNSSEGQHDHEISCKITKVPTISSASSSENYWRE